MSTVVRTQSGKAECFIHQEKVIMNFGLKVCMIIGEFYLLSNSTQCCLIEMLIYNYDLHTVTYRTLNGTYIYSAWTFFGGLQCPH